jgi:elongation factor P
MVRTKLRNLKTGATIDRTFRPEEKIALAQIEEKRMQYLYHQDDDYHFMDISNYEQISLSRHHLDEAVNYLKEGEVITIQFHEGEPVGVVLPIFVELKVIQTEPGVRGDTASRRFETGHTGDRPHPPGPALRQTRGRWSG